MWSPNGDPGGESDGNLDEPGRVRPRKSADAFRTISEVADDLHVPQHVLRFWETKFPRIKPLKRGGGRRYYRPDDVALLRRIADLLYTQGYTIKGVQRLLRESGGALHDDIPPASPEEQAEAAAERAGPAMAGAGIRPEPQPLPPEPSAPQGEDEKAERLRAALREVLAGLEALRRNLG
ncbi:MAG TPA: MerR family transcriptional regulator [Acetobacteraceae bacterium]|nr:MerR family transcriptional regulator [Acetobacteraceae bacterium]